MSKKNSSVLEYLSIETIVGPDLKDCFHGSPEESYFKSCVTNPQHIAALDYWLTLVREQASPTLPKWSSFKPQNIACILANVLVVELEDDDWVIRIVGENLVQMFKSGYTVGEKLQLFDVKGFSSVIEEQDKQVRKFHCPLLETGEVPIKGRQFLRYTGLMLPFRTGEEDVPNKMITVVCPYARRNTH